MRETWAIGGVDLHLDLRGTRVRAALETALRDAIRTGRLGSGERLPSSRSLAADLGVSRNTVASAFSQLVAEGWLSAAQGAGTRVAAAAVATDRLEPTRTPRAPRLDLRAGKPDVAAFPRSGWLAALRRALADAPASAFDYGDPRGRRELREALAAYLARARGVDADPERIVVCSGFAQGLGLVCTALRGTIAVEAFGHQTHRRIVEAAGLRTTTIAVDERGADVGSLTREDTVLLTPAHQFPLGVALAADRRNAVARWGGIVIEDDYDGEFRYDRQPVGALQALAPDRVVYAGTASKSLAPGLRLGWLVLPPELVEPVVEARSLTGGPSALDQLALAELIRSGGYDRHVRRARLAYRRRRDRLVAALPVTPRGIEAGLHCVVPADEERIVAAAEERGLLLEGLGEYTTGEHEPALVVGYGTPPEHAFDVAVEALLTVM